MSATPILEAFLARLATFTYSPQPEILWPGIQSDPPDEGMWLKPDFFPNRNRDRNWDDDACVERIGFCQVLVYFRVRPEVGEIRPSELADAIIDFFPKGTVLGPVRVKEQPSRSPKIDEDPSRSYIPVTIHYQGFS